MVVGLCEERTLGNAECGLCCTCSFKLQFPFRLRNQILDEEEFGDGGSMTELFLAGSQLGSSSAVQDNSRADGSAFVPEEMSHDSVPALFGASKEAC